MRIHCVFLPPFHHQSNNNNYILNHNYNKNKKGREKEKIKSEKKTTKTEYYLNIIGIFVVCSSVFFFSFYYQYNLQTTVWGEWAIVEMSLHFGR